MLTRTKNNIFSFTEGSSITIHDGSGGPFLGKFVNLPLRGGNRVFKVEEYSAHPIDVAVGD